MKLLPIRFSRKFVKLKLKVHWNNCTGYLGATTWFNIYFHAVKMRYFPYIFPHGPYLYFRRTKSHFDLFLLRT